jgi:Tol biopolymer transport system component
MLLLGAPAQPAAPRFERVYPLKAEEGVFAYSRISPDGRLLAYASEYRSGGGVKQTVTVVDLKDQKILFTEPGIDAYWSHDGKRMIYLSFLGSRGGVSLRNHETGEITRNIAPQSLGDYFSWAVRDGRNLILTIQSNYYYLNGNSAEMPNGTVSPCEGIGRGERPLISKDGMRITTFVRGTLVVRNLTDCDFILDTGIRGAKADFSWDNRYIAFHAQKANGDGYEIQIVDLKERTVRTVTNLPGPSLFRAGRRTGDCRSATMAMTTVALCSRAIR